MLCLCQENNVGTWHGVEFIVIAEWLLYNKVNSMHDLCHLYIK